MRTTGTIPVLLALILAYTGAEAASGIPCKPGDKACLLEASKAHPARGADYWQSTLSKPVGKRMGPAPQGLVEYLHIDNAMNGYPEKPRASRLAPGFVADVRGAMAA